MSESYTEDTLISVSMVTGRQVTTNQDSEDM